MREFFKKPMVFWSTYTAVAGTIAYTAFKDKNSGPPRTVTFQGIEYTFGDNPSNKNNTVTICPPFGGKCKSFDAEEQKTSVKNRV